MKRPKPPLRILVVEDEPLLAMDIQMMVEDAGHKVVAEATSLHDVEALPDDAAPDVVFVDLQLARNTNGLDVNRLVRRRWPAAIVVFVTANPKKLPEDFDGAHGVIAKPFSQNGFVSALHYLQEGVCDPPPVSPQPDSFVASPHFAAGWTEHS
jgi:CheY-like chemotaxis protein